MLAIAKHIITLNDFHLHLTHYGKEPDLPDLLLLHGFLGAGDQFRHLLPELSEITNPVTVDIIPDSGLLSSLKSNTYLRAGTGLIPDPNAISDPNAIPDPNAISDPNAIPDPNATSDSDPKQDHEPKSEFGSAPRTDPVPKPDFKLEASLLTAGLQKAIANFIRPRMFVLGYSMGARLALSWAVQYPDHVSGLLLESGTAGIADPEARKERRAADAIQAAKIRSDYHAFLEEWERNPLFMVLDRIQSRPHILTDACSHLRSIQQRQNPDQMARWLTDFGTGSMPPLHDELQNITCPVLLITGESDRKFCEIAAEMEPLFPDACHRTVPQAAHRVHIDAPDAYLSLIQEYLSDCDQPEKPATPQSGIL